MYLTVRNDLTPEGLNRFRATIIPKIFVFPILESSADTWSRNGGTRCRWKRKKPRTRIWSVCVRQSRLPTSHAIIRRLCTARSAADGSKMLTPGTKSGIRVCCLVVMRTARHRLAFVMKPFAIRCGTRDCDWRHKMHGMGQDQLQLCSAEFRKHCIRRNDLQE
jgi:hypothetical protein